MLDFRLVDELYGNHQVPERIYEIAYDAEQLSLLGLVEIYLGCWGQDRYASFDKPEERAQFEARGWDSMHVPMDALLPSGQIHYAMDHLALAVIDRLGLRSDPA